MSLFRIIVGVFLLQLSLVHIGRDVTTWYGYNGLLPHEAIKEFVWNNTPRLDMLLIFPRTNAGVMTFWYLYIATLICMTIGLFTRYATIFVWLALVTMHNLMPFNLNGGDHILRFYCMCMIFSESGASLSCDRLIKRFRHPRLGADAHAPLVPALGQRLLQIQTCLTYWSTVCYKLSGPQWLDGTAVYYALRQDDLYRFSCPFITDNLFLCKIADYFTIFIETAMFTLVWIKECRYWVLLGILTLHLGIDYFFNLPVFQWAMIAGLINFVDAADLAGVMNACNTRIARVFGPAQALLFNPADRPQAQLACVIEGLNI
ncbi:MAG: HTTM domain-containing protein, partial [Terriglobales bacterium]